MKKRNKHIGSSLEDFLKEEGVLEETRAVALKETLAWQVQQAMKKDKISKVEMARRIPVEPVDSVFLAGIAVGHWNA